MSAQVMHNLCMQHQYIFSVVFSVTPRTSVSNAELSLDTVAEAQDIPVRSESKGVLIPAKHLCIRYTKKVVTQQLLKKTN